MAEDDLQVPAYDRTAKIVSLYGEAPIDGSICYPAYDRAGALVALMLREAADDDLVISLYDRQAAIVAAFTGPETDTGVGYVFRITNCDEYTLTTNSWANKANTPAGNIPFESQTTGGGIFAVDLGVSRQLDRYIPNAWVGRTAPPAPNNRGVMSGVVGSFMYIFGGEQTATPGGDQTDEYSTVGNSWANKSDMIQGIDQHSGFGVGNAVFSCAGRGWTLPAGPLQEQKWTDRFIPAINTWAAMTDMPAPARFRVSGCSIGSYGYVMGGDDNIAPPIVDCDRYNPGGDSWASAQNILLAGMYGFAYSTGLYGYLCCINTDSDRNDQYNPITNSWTNKANTLVASFSCGARAP